jgi:hypothetical protein
MDVVHTHLPGPLRGRFERNTRRTRLIEENNKTVQQQASRVAKQNPTRGGAAKFVELPRDGARCNAASASNPAYVKTVCLEPRLGSPGARDETRVSTGSIRFRSVGEFLPGGIPIHLERFLLERFFVEDGLYINPTSKGCDRHGWRWGYPQM